MIVMHNIKKNWHSYFFEKLYVPNVAILIYTCISFFLYITMHFSRFLNMFFSFREEWFWHILYYVTFYKSFNYFFILNSVKEIHHLYIIIYCRLIYCIEKFLNTHVKKVNTNISKNIYISTNRNIIVKFKI